MNIMSGCSSRNEVWYSPIRADRCDAPLVHLTRRNSYDPVRKSENCTLHRELPRDSLVARVRAISFHTVIFDSFLRLFSYSNIHLFRRNHPTILRARVRGTPSTPNAQTVTEHGTMALFWASEANLSGYLYQREKILVTMQTTGRAL